MTSLLSEASPFSALIFDCDGTLVDTGPAHLAAYNHALAGHGFSIPPEFYAPRFGLSPQALLNEFAADRGASLDVSQIVAAYSEAFQANLDSLREIALIADIARAYRGKVPMAVASNGTRANVERTLATVGLRNLFNDLVAVDDVKHGKPAPDIYLEAARRLSVAPSECVVFEDTDEGLQAADDAGMRTVDVRPHLQ